ncbi:hypothetical protein Syun_009377 [Stephania yunnanensis]|uniref:Uncharacterized protein n=1 Tax=Stephania yunnanensis TaxID=152371 RepID=A0AAP0KG18_9MAGN
MEADLSITIKDLIIEKTKGRSSKEKNISWIATTKYDPTLKTVVVTCTEELAYQQAKEADNLLQKGVYLGNSSNPSTQVLCLCLINQVLLLQLNAQIAVLKHAREMEQPLVLEVDAKVKELRQTIQSLNTQQMSLKASFRTLRDKTKEIEEKISNADFALVQSAQENAKLRSKIVQSPEKLQNGKSVILTLDSSIILFDDVLLLEDFFAVQTVFCAITYFWIRPIHRIRTVYTWKRNINSFTQFDTPSLYFNVEDFSAVQTVFCAIPFLPVLAMESQAEALNQLTSDDLEGKSSSVDDNLASLKKELSGSLKLFSPVELAEQETLLPSFG